MIGLVPEPRYTRDGRQIPEGHATLICSCRPGYPTHECASIRNPPPCSYPGCGKPTAWLPSPDGFRWRHVIPDDETFTHTGHPFRRTTEELSA